MGDLVSFAALFGIYAALILDVFSSTNSSPQTTELFASERAASLWRWVKMGAVVSLVFIALGAYTAHREGKNYLAPIAGGMVALGLMWFMYSHALTKGGGQKPETSAGYFQGWH